MPLSVSLTVATISLEMGGGWGGKKRLNDRGRVIEGGGGGAGRLLFEGGHLFG